LKFRNIYPHIIILAVITALIIGCIYLISSLKDILKQYPVLNILVFGCWLIPIVLILAYFILLKYGKNVKKFIPKKIKQW